MTVVFINGLGLIGSSVANIIKTTDPTVQIIGHDLNPNNEEYLIDQQIVDRTVPFATGCQQADIIILATPVNQIIASLKQLTTLTLKPNALVTDVGSNKQPIVAAAQPFIIAGGHFLGGHPMAGSHLTGSRNGSQQLLAHHTYFLTNCSATPVQINHFKTLLAAGQFQFQMISAPQHDNIVSAISYLPHVVAFSLINTVAPELTANHVKANVPAGGLLDTTRIAMSDPTMWTAILSSSREQVINQIEQFEIQLHQMKAAIQNNKPDQIQNQIAAAQHARKQMEAPK